MVGTPEYASIRVLDGHTPSRRDDLEALGYVIADLVLQAVRCGSHKKKKGRKGESATNGTGTATATFPWSQCRSDEEVLRVKMAEVGGGGMSGGGSSPGKRRKKKSGAGGGGGAGGGTFFASMGVNGNDDVEVIMREYFDAVRELEYAEKPDYDALRDIVADLSVRVGTPSTTAGSGAAAADFSASFSLPTMTAADTIY
jgi:hypothetical protein